MPAWGAVDARLGNNPLVLGVPFEGEAIVLDMAMSQFSYGSIELHQRTSSPLPIPGGYNNEGLLTTDPNEIIESRRLLPAGYWKGSGLALLLDLLATILSGGLSTARISRREAEFALSQVFISIDISQLTSPGALRDSVYHIIKDLHDSVPVDGTKNVLYPGERVLRIRAENLKNGIPIEQSIWQEVKRL